MQKNVTDNFESDAMKYISNRHVLSIVFKIFDALKFAYTFNLSISHRYFISTEYCLEPRTTIISSTNSKATVNNMSIGYRPACMGCFILQIKVGTNVTVNIIWLYLSLFE